MTKKDQNLDETDREESFVSTDEYGPTQGGINFIPINMPITINIY
jgi:hypothetical protein